MFLAGSLWYKGAYIRTFPCMDTEGRRKKKLISKTSWYCPRDALGFFPVGPGQETYYRDRRTGTEEPAGQNRPVWLPDDIIIVTIYSN